MTSPCRTETLSLYLDDGLTLPERHRVEEHLRSCARCREELDGLRRIDEILAAWARQSSPVPAGAATRMAGSVDRRRRLSPLVSLSRMVPAAVGSSIAALLVLVSVNAGLLYQGESASGPSSTYQHPSFASQVRKLTDARRAAAIQGVVLQQPVLAPRHRTQFDFN
jgi:anti-sigma factor RsiW